MNDLSDCRASLFYRRSAHSLSPVVGLLLEEDQTNTHHVLRHHEAEFGRRILEESR
jgi:hypothetical protein